MIEAVTKIKESIDLSGFKVGEAYDKEGIAAAGRITPPSSPSAGSWGTGIVAFDNAVLLLVTLVKDAAGYNDFIDGKELHWQSQYQQSQESSVIKRMASGQSQAHLFARVRGKVRVNGKERAESFIYCGRLAWVSMERQYPVDCLFHLMDRPAVPNEELQALFSWRPKVPADELGRSIVEATISAGKQMAAVNSELEARDVVQRAIAVRRGQKGFRTKLLRAYQKKCVVTGCTVVDILEAAHIVPYKGAHTHRVDNGLLLRSDIHTLFDLGLIWVSQQRRLQLHAKLRDGEYGYLHDEPLRAPVELRDLPLLEHLAYHEKLASERRVVKPKKKSVA